MVSSRAVFSIVLRARKRRKPHVLSRYRTEYNRFSKPAVVPRGQHTASLDKHYNYGRIAAGTPEVRVMNGFMEQITADVNTALGTTILFYDKLN